MTLLFAALLDGDKDGDVGDAFPDVATVTATAKVQAGKLI